MLGQQLVYSKPASAQQEQGLNSTLPQCIDQLQIRRNMNTGALSTAFPFTSADLTDDKGILYGINMHNSGLVIFDRFSLENANSLVFAKSGAGKSFTVKLEALRSLMLGVEVFIIDPENEYQRMCDAVGGAYVKLSLNSPTRINPLDKPSSDPPLFFGLFAGKGDDREIDVRVAIFFIGRCMMGIVFIKPPTITRPAKRTNECQSNGIISE
jgi:hypothetical protein